MADSKSPTPLVVDDNQPFDARAVVAHRRRAQRRFGDHDFLFREVADRLADRLNDIRRRFPVALEIGARGTILQPGMAGIERLLRLDRVPGPGVDLVFDGETLPCAEASLDLVFSVFDLHWVNDLPGLLMQIQRALRPDGLLLAALAGGGTLGELRECLMAAELELAGGISPRVSPFLDLRDGATLLQRAGFALPVADSETITVTYADLFTLMRDLRGMGETNAVRLRGKGFTRRTVMLRAAQLYAARHAGADGPIPATFQIVTLTGWRPDASQQVALRPGGAKARLAAALGVVEHSAGEKAGE
jgi:SAM-dependent methyltransferase